LNFGPSADLAFSFRFHSANWLSKSLSQKVKSPNVLIITSCPFQSDLLRTNFTYHRKHVINSLQTTSQEIITP